MRLINMPADLPTPQIRKKSIRSFVIRAGRLTDGQRKSMEYGWPQIGLDLEEGVEGFERAFERQAPRVLEIGYGMGQSLLAMAEAEPEKDFVGIEVHPPGVGSLLLGAYDLVMSQVRIPNLKTYMADATDVLRECIRDARLSRIQIYFPDPWPKKKHHKRRLVQPDLLGLLVDKLEIGGVLHMATDWQPYAEHMLEVLHGEPRLENTVPVGDYAPRPDWRPSTRFEVRGEKLGHAVFDLVFTRKS